MWFPLLLPGDESAISGDRPGFLNSSSLVPLGRLQLETGLGFARGGTPDTLTTPVALRYGLRDELELRASSSGWNRADEQGAPDERGWGGLTLGVKAPLPRDFADLDLRGVDSVAWFGELTLPTGTFAPDARTPAATLGAVASWTPGGSSWQWSGTAGFTSVPAQDLLVLDLALSATRPLSGGTSLYLESGYFPGLHTESDPLYVGAGLIALPSTDVQLDLTFDLGLGEASGSWFGGIGVCWRW
jgi:hypothetical protein